MKILETERLVIRPFTPEDAPFMLELLNDPGWIANIGNRGVHTVEAARDYIETRMLAMYRRVGYGMWVVESKATGEAIGTSGLVKRDSLEHTDIGFAFLERHCRQGYALEAARATLEYALHPLALGKIVAIVSRSNTASIRLLEKIGLRRAGTITMPGDGEELAYFET
jgi:ribosomal-protein-alanine N-acetyltransferase